MKIFYTLDASCIGVKGAPYMHLFIVMMILATAIPVAAQHQAFIVDGPVGDLRTNVEKVILRHGGELIAHPDVANEGGIMARIPNGLAVNLKKKYRLTEVHPLMLQGKRAFRCGTPDPPLRNEKNGKSARKEAVESSPGWDGPGQNATTLTYTYENMVMRNADGTIKRPEDLNRYDVEWAMAHLSALIKVTFAPGGFPGAERNINYLIGKDYLISYEGHYPSKCPYIFTVWPTGGAAAAHGFYPPRLVNGVLTGETLAGDIHFNAEEDWNPAIKYNFPRAALHELGHAVGGLGHNGRTTSLMYEWTIVGAPAEFDVTDIEEMRSQYEANYGVIPPYMPPPGSGDGSGGDGRGRASLSISASIVQPAQQANFSVTGTVSGGTAPYTLTAYVNGVPVQPPTQLAAAGLYTISGLAGIEGTNNVYVSVTDSTSPPETLNSPTVTIEFGAPPPPPPPPPPGGLTVTLDQPPAPQSPNISITGTVSGGTAPYTLTAFVNGAAGPSINLAAAGPYQIDNVPLVTGMNTIYVVVSDSASPAATTNSETRTVDNTRGGRE